MYLQIFDVEHGACALVTCENAARLMIDCGHNATTGWRPGAHLKQQGIVTLEQLAITNYDEDHVSGIADLLGQINVQWLYRNRSVSAQTIQHLKSEDGMGSGIERLVQAIDNTFTGSTSGAGVAEPVFAGLERQYFYNDYPAIDDENNLSLVVHLKCHGVGIMFPGDLETAGWRALLQRQDFRQALSDTNVLIASHHGRENGCCDEIFEYCKPFYIVISDKGYMYDTQQTIPYYRRFTRGGSFRGETRHVLTTRSDGPITFVFNPPTPLAPVSWGPY